MDIKGFEQLKYFVLNRGKKKEIIFCRREYNEKGEGASSKIGGITEVLVLIDRDTLEEELTGTSVQLNEKLRPMIHESNLGDFWHPVGNYMGGSPGRDRMTQAFNITPVKLIANMIQNLTGTGDTFMICVRRLATPAYPGWSEFNDHKKVIENKVNNILEPQLVDNQSQLHV